MNHIKLLYRNIIVFIFLSLTASFAQTGIAQVDPATNPGFFLSDESMPGKVPQADTMRIRFRLGNFSFYRNVPARDSSLSITAMLLPAVAKSHTRISLVSDFTENRIQYQINSSVQQYYDQHIELIPSGSIFDLSGSIMSGIVNDKPPYIKSEIINSISTLSEKDMLYAVWRSKVVHAQNEAELSDLIRISTREMIDHGYTDLGSDLLPFISVLMQEQHIFHYDEGRVLVFSPRANGIVSVIDMLSSMASLDEDEKAGVCRDTHDSGLRIARSMYDEYLKYKYPDKHYRVDDYIFLQAWVTPPSHHVTIVVIDPENPRNLYELDWGRVYQKVDQEGIVIGNTVGTTIRLWRFDEEKNRSVSFDLRKTQWGLLLDKEILPEKEFTSINGIYCPLYANYGNYIRKYGERTNLSLALGMFNAGQPFFLTSLSYTTRKIPISPLFRFKGIMGIQTMILDDSERRNYTLPWADWHRTLNSLNGIRYMAVFNTRDFKLNPNVSMNFFLNSQMDILFSFAYYRVENGGELSNFSSSGDGNVWFSYGSELNYINHTGTFGSGIRLMQRNYLMPNDVRCLSPNPLALLGHASVVNNAFDAEIFILVRTHTFEIKPEFAFEQNRLQAQFIKLGLTQNTSLGKRCRLNLKVAHFKQVNGIEYYWYPVETSLLEAGIQHKQKKWVLGFNCRLINGDYPAHGLYLQKSF